MISPLKDYSLDIFFRQMWVDKRLSFDLSTDGIYELVIGSDMLHKIWLPDTFIGNFEFCANNKRFNMTVVSFFNKSEWQKDIFS